MKLLKKISYRLLTSISILAVLVMSVIPLLTVVQATKTSDYSNCTYRIEPENYYINSLESSELRRDYTYLYDDGMNDGDNSELIAMGSYVYASGNESGGGKLTYKLPYATNELLLTGIEKINDEKNSFQNFEVSADGENWQRLDMTAIYENSVTSTKSAKEVGDIRGVKYYGSTTENFAYFRVEFGRCWLPGINYLYIPKSDAMANCKNKVDPISLTRSINNANATFKRYNTYTYDGVGGATFNKAGCTVTFTLPYAVDSLSFTAVEIYWPNSAREKFHFRDIEVSMDGENWSQFTTAAGNFQFVAKNVGSGALNGVTYPIHRLGVTYFGTSNTTFRYIRMKSDAVWEPGLCNFYLPDTDCVNRIEPETYYENSLEGNSTLKRNGVYMYDDGMNDGEDTDKLVAVASYVYSKGNENGGGKLTYKLPYDVNELLLTGMEVPNDRYNSFQGFEVSNDGANWQTFDMNATYEDKVLSTVSGRDVGRIKGVKYYGSSSESFRYFRVEFGRCWLPGINYLYIPQSDALADCTVKINPMSLSLTDDNASVTFKRYTSGTVKYDGVYGAAFAGNTGGTVTFTLPDSVTSLAYTTIDVYRPDNYNFSFKNVEISPDGVNWYKFTTAATNFDYVVKDVRSIVLNGNTVPVHRLGVTYFGTSDISFRYIRMKSNVGWDPQLCNFYLPQGILSDVSITGGSMVFVGQDLKLSATAVPSTALLPSIRWAVENGTGSATISQDGILHAVSEGTVAVKAIANGTDITGTLQVKIVTGNSCTGRLDPVNMIQHVVDTGSDELTYTRNSTYKYDGSGILCFNSKATNGGKMVFELPHDTNELKMTGIEVITYAETNASAADSRFKKFRVSSDGVNWYDLDIARKTDGYVDPGTNHREGVVIYGCSDTAFRYIEVTFGKSWIPGISYFYVPPKPLSGIQINGATDVFAGSSVTYSVGAVPEYVKAPKVTWSVQNGTGSATVSANGTLLGKKAGTVTLKATAKGNASIFTTKQINVVDDSACNYQVDPVDAIYNISDTVGGKLSTYGRNSTYKHDGIGILCFQKNAPSGGKMFFELPYATNQLRMTGIEIITNAALTSDPDNFRFHSVRVSNDGSNWTVLTMARRIDGFVDGKDEKREGVTLYGVSATKFRYVEVDLGKCWIPGISYFYIPTAEVSLDHYEWDLYLSAKPAKLTATLKSNVSGTVKFSSDNPSVLTVDSEGNIKLNAVGKANVTVSAGGYSSVCKITVHEGYGPDGCTQILDAYGYIYNSSDTVPKRGGSYAVPGGKTYPLIFLGNGGLTSFDDEPVLIYRLPYEVNEIKMTALDDTAATSVHTFAGFWVSSDGNNWKKFDMSVKYEGGGWAAATFYGRTENSFKYIQIKFTKNINWCPGIGHIFYPPNENQLESEYGAIISAKNALAKADSSDATYEVSEDSGAWHLVSDEYSFSSGNVAFKFPYAITSYCFNVVDAYDLEEESGYSYWASSDGVTYKKLDNELRYVNTYDNQARTYTVKAYGKIDESENIRYLMVHMNNNTNVDQAGVVSLQLNATDYPVRNALPDYEEAGDGEETLIDTFKGDGFTTDEDGKAYEVFQMQKIEIDQDGRGNKQEVVAREAGYSDSYLTYKLSNDVLRLSIRGYRSTSCEEEPLIYTSTSGEEWELLESPKVVKEKAVTGDYDDLMYSFSDLSEGVRYIKVEIPALDNIKDLTIYGVQIMYGDGSSHSAMVIVICIVTALVVLSACVFAVVLFLKKRRKVN